MLLFFVTTEAIGEGERDGTEIISGVHIEMLIGIIHLGLRHARIEKVVKTCCERASVFAETPFGRRVDGHQMRKVVRSLDEWRGVHAVELEREMLGGGERIIHAHLIKPFGTVEGNIEIVIALLVNA